MRRSEQGASTFVAESAGRYRLDSPLQFSSVPRLRRAGLELIAAAPAELTLDLSHVAAVDSAGLALLIDWLASARAQKKTLHYAQPPEALLALARLSEVERLIVSG